MKVLMFGWEFPPYSSGGLGTACYGLTKGLANHGAKVKFVIPKAFPEMKADFVKLLSPGDIKECSGCSKKIAINSIMKGYMTSEEYQEEYEKYRRLGFVPESNKGDVYGKNLYLEVLRYAEKAGNLAEVEDHDIIHCHDWLTYKAGINAKKKSGKPLVVHIHATEFDRTANNPNQFIYDIEREGLHAADRVFAVSNFTKDKIVKHYGVDPDKVQVVHNAVDFNENRFEEFDKIKKNDKIVLFLGRITIQKGPDWFLHAAKKALDIDPNIKFIIAGSGDMHNFMVEKAAELGIADKVLFAGFLRGEEIDKAYQMADLYVMPSISEPFGITPLEAMRNNTPVLISKQSGVSEVINHCLKVDFWDIDQMANKMLGVLNHAPLKGELQYNGMTEVKRFDWNISAKKCIEGYSTVIKGCK